MKKIKIKEAAEELGVSQETLRRWEAAGKIKVTRTPKGHRRYDLMELKGITSTNSSKDRLTICYARVSSTTFH